MPSWNSREYAKRLAYQEQGLTVQFVAWAEEVPVGRAMVVFPGHPEWMISGYREGTPDLRDVEVVEAWRRRGVGKRLVEACCGETARRGFDRLGLMVSTDEAAGPARTLYEALGFELVHGPFISTTRLEAEDGTWFAVGTACVYMTRTAALAD
jgi:[ribosomal protein S18]-alanine N-acetyltransferase